MSIKKIIVVDNEEREAGSIGSEGSKGSEGKEAASPLFSGCCPRIVSLPLELFKEGYDEAMHKNSCKS